MAARIKKLRFVEQESRYGVNGHDAMLGRWKVGWVGWDRLAKEDLPYSARCRLPGIKEHLGRFNTEEEARAKLQTAVDLWLYQTKVQPDT